VSRLRRSGGSAAPSVTARGIIVARAGSRQSAAAAPDQRRAGLAEQRAVLGVDSGRAAMSEPLPHDLPPLITRYRWRARIGTALAIVIVGGTLGVVWYYALRAPSPRRVCDH